MAVIPDHNSHELSTHASIQAAAQRLGILDGGVAGKKVLEPARIVFLGADLGLRGHFDRIVEAPKQSRLYERVMRMAGAPDRAHMVGDQLDRDIAPARQAGLVTIYFPGSFQPRWTPDENEVRPDHRISFFAEVPGIVLNGGTGALEHAVDGSASGASS